jgi:hypothetical protein
VLSTGKKSSFDKTLTALVTPNGAFNTSLFAVATCGFKSVLLDYHLYHNPMSTNQSLHCQLLDRLCYNYTDRLDWCCQIVNGLSSKPLISFCSLHHRHHSRLYLWLLTSLDSSSNLQALLGFVLSPVVDGSICSRCFCIVRYAVTITVCIAPCLTRYC